MSKPGAAALLTFACFACTASAQEADPAGEIRATLTKWTDDFNAGNKNEVCAIFAPDLRYDYRGFPERGYQDICSTLQRSLSDRATRYSYALAIKEILVAGDLAVVRLVWTLTVRARDSAATVSQEPGMDVFRRQPDGRWKIVRYIAYEN
jgi:steroid delta-isomerase